MRRPLLLVAAPLLAAALLLPGVASLSAQTSGPSVSTNVESRFPDGLHFDVSITSAEEIAEARLRFLVLGEQVARNAPLEFEPSRSVSAQLLVRTDTAPRYIPPGAEIEFSVEVTGAAGAVTESEPRRFVFLDPRHEWTRIDAPGVYLHYYGGQEGRARRALEAAQETLVRMGDLMGIEETDTLRLTVYNSIGAMRRALPPRSQVQEGVLVTEGVSFGDTGVVLLLGGNPEVEGVAAHETVHFLMRFAVGRGASLVPAWLNEGLAEYANPFPSRSFQSHLLPPPLRQHAAPAHVPHQPARQARGQPADVRPVRERRDLHGRDLRRRAPPGAPRAPRRGRHHRRGPHRRLRLRPHGPRARVAHEHQRPPAGRHAEPLRAAHAHPAPDSRPLRRRRDAPPEPTRPRPSPTQPPAETAPDATQSSGGCNRAEGSA